MKWSSARVHHNFHIGISIYRSCLNQMLVLFAAKLCELSIASANVPWEARSSYVSGQIMPIDTWNVGQALTRHTWLSSLRSTSFAKLAKKQVALSFIWWKVETFHLNFRHFLRCSLTDDFRTQTIVEVPPLSYNTIPPWLKVVDSKILPHIRNHTKPGSY